MPRPNGDVRRHPTDDTTSDRVIRRLIARRVALGLTQYELAAKLGWKQAKVSRVEHGTNRNARVEELVAYAAAVGMRLNVRLTTPAPDKE